MNRLAIVLLAASFAVSPLLGGCSGTRAVAGGTPGQGTAFIVPENGFNRARAAGPFTPQCATGQVLVRICGQCLGGRNRFQVPAGRSTVQVAFKDDETPQDAADSYDDMVLETKAISLTFDAQAGHTYAVRGQARWSGLQPTVTLWIVDGADGRTVTSAVVPPANVSVAPIRLPFGG